MRVLYLVSQAVLGGHVLSAFSVARTMKQHGVHPVFAGGRGAMSEEIRQCIPLEEVDIPIFHRERPTYFTWTSIRSIRRLRKIIQTQRINLVHAFDARAYMHAFPAGLLQGIPVLCTLCGGIDPYYGLPAAPKMIVFSEEQKRRMVRVFGWRESRVMVVRTRLDFGQLHAHSMQLSDREAKALGLSDRFPKIMMISSFDDTKIQSIHKVLDAVEQLFSEGMQFQMVFIGGKGPLFEQAKTRGKSFNGRYGTAHILFTGPIVHAFRLLQRATVVLGVGRSAFEGMAYGIPTLIVGENGFAGEVAEETLDALAFYNFSGRNIQEESSSRNLVEVIRNLLADEQRRQRIGAFACEFVHREIDVAQGSKRIAEIYSELTKPGNSLLPIRCWISFAACLIPIMRDNEIYSAKRIIRRLAGMN